MALAVRDDALGCRNAGAIKQLLLKLDAVDLKELNGLWGRFPEADRKAQLDSLIEVSRFGISHRQLAQADIRHVRRQVGKTWTAWTMNPSVLSSSMAPERVLTSLRSYLANLYAAHAHVEMFDRNMWIRLLFLDNLSADSTSPLTSALTFVHVTNTPFVLSTAIRSSNREIALQALSVALGCVTLVPRGLTGPDAASLERLLQTYATSTPGDVMRLGLLSTNPLDADAHRKRRAAEAAQAEAEGGQDADEDHLRLDQSAVQDQKRARNDLLGDAELPSLRRLEIVVDGRLEETGDEVLFRVSLEGASVLEGLRQLYAVTMTRPPAFLGDLASACANTVRLTASTGHVEAVRPETVALADWRTN